MTRKQIEKKAEEIARKLEERLMETTTLPRGEIEIRGDYAEDAATDMACWMLSNLWVSVEDELPPKGEIVIAHYGNFSSVGLTFACWDGKGWKQEERDVTHWMPIPLLAEKGGTK